MTHARQNFRCVNGCCICGTKSSTSRFTSSNNYEAYFHPCFLVQHRKGEICNACVLIVKRFIKNPHSGHNWHHIVDNGHNKKNRKKVSLKIRLLSNNTGRNYDIHNLPPSVSTSNSNSKEGPKFAKYRHRTREQRAADSTSDSEWLQMGNPDGPNTFFRHHDPYPRISAVQHIMPKPCSQTTSPRQHTTEEIQEQHLSQNTIQQPCLSKPCKPNQEPREQTLLHHQSSKQLALVTPPQYPSPLDHHCYPTPATTPDLNTSSSSSSYSSSRQCVDRCSSLSPSPASSCNYGEDDSPYTHQEDNSSYLSSSLDDSVCRSSTSHQVNNPLNHLCQAIDSHRSSSLVRCPDMWQTQEEGVSSLVDDSGCYDDEGSSSQDMGASCSPYNSPYPSPCPSDPVGVEDDDSLHCLSAIVADRPRLPVPRVSFADTLNTGLTATMTSRHSGSASRVTFAIPGGARYSKRKQRAPKKGGRATSLALDVVTGSPYWTKKKTCCGIVNMGQNSEVLLMAGQYKPCIGGHHDPTCAATLQRMSLDTRGRIEEESSDMSENSSDSFDMMTRDMALLNTRTPSTGTSSTMTSPASSSMTSPASSSTSDDSVNGGATTSSVWTEPSPPSCQRKQLQSEASNSGQQQQLTRDEDQEMDDYQVNMYNNWNSYYPTDAGRQRMEEEAISDSGHPDVTYFREVSMRPTAPVSVSKVDALGALDLTKETGASWGRRLTPGVH